MPVQIQFRRGTASEWTSANPTLSAGEVGFETDTNKFKLGTGSTAWTSLSYTSPITASSADTLTNKTLTSPVISSITNTGTLTLPTSTDTLVGKATTDTLTNKTISATSNTLTGVINNTLTSTTGDIIYASAANTPARLAAGTSGYVLTSGGASTAPSWAAAAAGGMTLINSGGTTLSGTTTTVSSIPSTYKQLQIIVRGAKPVTIDTIIALRLNTDTGTNYFAINTPTTGATGQTFNNTYFVMNSNGLSNDADAQYNSAWVTLPDYSTTTNYKTIQSLDFSKYAYGGVTQNWSASLKYGAYSSATVISSISIVITGASGATAGTVFVYGVS